MNTLQPKEENPKIKKTKGKRKGGKEGIVRVEIIMKEGRNKYTS